MTPAFKRHIRKLVKYFARAVFAHEYSKQIRFVNEVKKTDNGGQTLATINCNSRYLEFTVTFYKGSFDLWEDKEWWMLADVVLHEMCHIITDPLYEISMLGTNSFTKEHLVDVNERQTQRIANAILALVPASAYTPAKLRKSNT